MRNNYLLAAGIICLFTALLHTVGGQITLVDPMFSSDMGLQPKTEWLGAWHIITILLWAFGLILFRNGLRSRADQKELLRVIMLLCFLFTIPFIGASLWTGVHAPQYTLFLAIAILAYLGRRKILIPGVE